MRALYRVLVPVISLGLIGAASAQISLTAESRNEYRARCASDDPAISIAACAVLIQSGEEPPQNLVFDLMYRAIAYDHEQDYSREAADLGRALEIKPDYVPALLKRATLYRFKRDFGRSIADFDAAIRIAPDEAAYQGRGLSYYLKRDYAQAIADFTAAIGQPGDVKYAWYYRAMAYMHQGDAGKSQADFAKAEQLGVPVESEAGIYTNNLDLDRALATYDRALQQKPGEVTYAGRGYTHWLNGDLDAAIADYSHAVEIDPTDWSDVEMRGLVYRAKGDKVHGQADIDKAIVLAGEGITRAPKKAGVWNNRCWARALAGEALTKALDDCNAALKLMPNYAAGLDSRAMVYFRMKQYGKALSDYEKALAISPGEFQSLFMRGVTRIRLGRKGEGQADIATAKDLLPVVEREYAFYGIVP